MVTEHETCRRLTKRIIFGNKDCNNIKPPLIILPGCFFVCKCQEIDNLTIHHEVYPKSIKAIIRAINRRKIYMLCSDCHNKLNKVLIQNGN